MNKNILILFTCLLLSSCAIVGKIERDDASLKEVSMTFQRVVDELESFKARTGSYPSFKELSSCTFWNEVTTKEIIRDVYSYEYQGIEFNYQASGEALGLSEEERSSWGGYQLSIPDIREFFNIITSWDIGIVYIYRPSHYYPERKYNVLIKQVENWGLFRLYNTKGGPNPVDSN
ncbi:MAG: hypothetical protein GY777_29640 [Candidatus Brocadiaceae bacterium]|nr:hypothetical protein [Candidatus Brocadiaceae bacterium]